jgi:hypothetical protein
MFSIGDPVRWVSPNGETYFGVVRWIAPGTQTLHITCDPKRCSEDHGPWHVAGAVTHAVEYDNPTLF